MIITRGYGSQLVISRGYGEGIKQTGKPSVYAYKKLNLKQDDEDILTLIILSTEME